MTTTPAPVLRAIVVPATPAEAFSVFTEQIGAWWPTTTHTVYDDQHSSVAFEDGRIVERALDGSVTTWGEVRVWDEPNRLVFSWHPGSAGDVASEVEVRFAPDDGGGTRVELAHHGWERFGQAGFSRRRGYVGPGAWGAVLEHYADVVETPADAPDQSALRAAYDEFFAEALAPGHDPAPEGEWDAAQVVAHVALNEVAMTAVSNAITNRRNDIRFENVTCQDRAVLAGHIARYHGDLPAMVDDARRLAAASQRAFARLGAAQRTTPVHCRLEHGGATVVDDPVPWQAIALDAQTHRHLPGHTGQLRDLRGSDTSAASA